MEESRGTGLPLAALLGTPPTHWHSPGGDPNGEVPPINPQHPITCFPTNTDQVAAHYS